MAWSNYRELIVWQKSMTLVKDVYMLIASFPAYEQYALSSQLRRSVVSIPSNIAEGEGRQTKKEFINFLHIANGSLYELETQISIAESLDYISKQQSEEIFSKCAEIGKMISKLIDSLNTKN